MKVSGMTRLNTAEYKFILIVVFLNFNLLLLLGACPAGEYRDTSMAVCKTCPVNKVSKTEGLGKCEPCEVGTLANLDRTICGEFELRCYI